MKLKIILKIFELVLMFAEIVNELIEILQKTNPF